MLQQHGTSAAGSPAWQEFARRHRFALVFGGGELTDTLESYLAAMAKASNHPEVVNLPLCAFGGSMGGWFSAKIGDKYPQRLIAAVAGFSGIWPVNSGFPMLFPINELDATFYSASKPIAQDFINSFFPNRGKGALWTAAVIWGNKGHAVTDWEHLSLLYFDFFIRHRLPAYDPKAGPPALLPYPLEKGLLSPLYDGLQKPFPPLYPYADLAAKNTAHWLPDSSFGFIWRAFVTTQPQVALTGPAAFTVQASSQVPLRALPLAGKSVPRQVAFYSGSRLLGSDDSAPFEVTACLESGAHGLSAVAVDTAGQETASRLVTVVVKEGVTPCISSPVRKGGVPGRKGVSEMKDNPGKGRGARGRIRGAEGSGGRRAPGAGRAEFLGRSGF